MSVFFVTGGSGFIATYMISELLDCGHKVVMSSRSVSNAIKNKRTRNLECYQCDLSEQSSLNYIVNKHQPDYVIHLAGQSSPSFSWSNPQKTMNDNYNKTANLLLATACIKKDCKFIYVSSSSVYSDANYSDPITEEFKTDPSSPYGISKLAAEKLCMLFYRLGNVNTIVVRPFFITGVGKIGDVCSDWCKQAAEIELGHRDNLQTGVIEGVSRDFMDVTDCVKALKLIALSGIPGSVYNIATGSGIVLNDLLSRIIKLTNKKVSVIQNPKLISKKSETVRIGCSKKLKKLGWKKEKLFDQTLLEMFDNALKIS